MATEITEASTGRTVQTAKWKMHYNEAGSGHPLILLHGSGPGASGWSNYSQNIPALAEHFRVLALDFVGWGQSDPVSFQERDNTEAVKLFMDALDIDRAAFVGNSLGGMISLRMAVHYPSRVSHVITMGSGSGGVKITAPGDGPSEGMKVLFETYRDPSPESMRRLVEIMTYDHARFSANGLAETRSEAARRHQVHLDNFNEGAAFGPGDIFCTEEQLAAITAPCLLMHGRDDRVVGMEHTLKLVSLIPDSRAVLFNRCGHWAQLEHAEEFNRLVSDFVRNH